MKRVGTHLCWTIAAALLVASCGNDDGSGAEEDTAPEATTVDTGDDGVESVDDEGSDSAADADAVVSGDSGSSWCEQVRAAESGDEASPINFDFFGLSAEQIETQFKEGVETIERWAESAPPEIEDSVDTIVGAFGTFVELGDAAGWDINAMATDPEFAAAFDSAELTEATAAVDEYNREVCGVDLSAGVADDATAELPEPVDGDVVAQFLAGFGLPPDFLTEDQRNCMNEQLSVSLPDGLEADFTLDQDLVTAFDEAAERCGV